MTNKNLLLLTASYAAIGYFQYVFFYWLQYYYKKVLLLDDVLSRRYSMFPTLAMAGGMFFGGWLYDRVQSRVGGRLGRAIIPVCGMTASALLLLAGLAAKEPLWAVAWFSLAMGAAGMSEGPFWVSAVEAGGEAGGMSAAIFNTGGNVVGMVAPALTPVIAHYSGDWRTGFALSSVLCWRERRPGCGSTYPPYQRTRKVHQPRVDLSGSRSFRWCGDNQPAASHPRATL